VWITRQTQCSICYRSYSQFLFSHKTNIISSVWCNYHCTLHNIPKEYRSHHVFCFYIPSINSRKLGIRHWVSWDYIPWNTVNINFLLNKMTAWRRHSLPPTHHSVLWCMCKCNNCHKNMASMCQFSWKSYMFNSIMFRSLYQTPSNSGHKCAKCGQNSFTPISNMA
jgi:hypothetical protein